MNYTYGYNLLDVRLGIQDIVNWTQYSYRQVQRSLKELEAKNIITTDNRRPANLRVQKDYEAWKLEVDTSNWSKDWARFWKDLVRRRNQSRAIRKEKAHLGKAESDIEENPNEHQVVNKRPYPGKHSDTDGVLENPVLIEEKKKKKTITDVSFPKDFTTLWEAYPRKIAKQTASKAYTARRRAGDTADELLLATHHYAVSVKGTAEKYVLHAATFLGPDERWRDYLVKPDLNGKPQGQVECATCRRKIPKATATAKKGGQNVSFSMLYFCADDCGGAT